MKKQKYLPPTYYEGFITYDNESYFGKLLDIEWRGQIKSSTNNRKFRIKYYGEFFEEYKLIANTDLAPELIFAEDIETNEKILLFDGCKHGYDAMLCDEYSSEQINNRPLSSTFIDNDGQEIFEVLVSVYYNIDYEDELVYLQNEAGNIELVSGEIISTETLLRNGFDFLAITVINEKGNKQNIFEKELA